MQSAKTGERLSNVKEVREPGMIFRRCRDHYQQLATGAQPRETDLEVLTDRVELSRRQKPVLECRFAEAAQQRTPVVVRTVRMIGDRIFVVVPKAGQLLLESRHGLIGPCPMA